MASLRAMTAAVAAAVLLACEEPAEPDGPQIEVAYLLDRVGGIAPPAQICDDGGVVQLLRFESIALADDSTYGRLQQIEIEDEVFEQEEHGDFSRTDSTILLVNATADTLTLRLLDDEAEFVRRIHPCGDTLRYRSVPVGDD